MSGGWHSSACRLMDLARRIERASTEEEESRLCDERDRLLSFFRRLDELTVGAPADQPKVRTSNQERS